MREKIVELFKDFKRLQLELQSFAFLSSYSRNRRSLIPFSGRIMSHGFGLEHKNRKGKKVYIYIYIYIYIYTVKFRYYDHLKLRQFIYLSPYFESLRYSFLHFLQPVYI